MGSDTWSPWSSCKVPLTSTAPCMDTGTGPCGPGSKGRTYKSNGKAVHSISVSFKVLEEHV